jgi:hypothetical protein
MYTSKISRSLTYLVGSILTVFVYSTAIYACDCTGPRGRDAIREGSPAFRGVVTEIKDLGPFPDRTEPTEHRIVVTFAVSKVWNGEVGTSFQLHTANNLFSCAGYYFKRGEEYLVVADPNKATDSEKFYGVKKSFTTNSCGSTLEIKNAKDELAALGGGRTPKD